MELELLLKKMQNKEKVYYVLEELDIVEEIDFADQNWHYDIIETDLFGKGAELQLGRWFYLDAFDMENLDTWYWLSQLKEKL